MGERLTNVPEGVEVTRAVSLENMHKVIVEVSCLDDANKVEKTKKRKIARALAKDVLSTPEHQRPEVVAVFRRIYKDSPTNAFTVYNYLKRAKMMGRADLRRFLGAPPKGRFIRQ